MIINHHKPEEKQQDKQGLQLIIRRVLKWRRDDRVESRTLREGGSFVIYSVGRMEWYRVSWCRGRVQSPNDLLYCSQLSPCGHPAITDTPMIRTAAKSQTKINRPFALVDHVINFR